jgi:hypothetical protein
MEDMNKTSPDRPVCAWCGEDLRCGEIALVQREEMDLDWVCEDCANGDH